MSTTIPERNIPTKALVVSQVKEPFVFQDVILDGVRDDEVLVEVKYTGLCHTDIVVQNGEMPVGDFPAVLGHEGAGIVRRVGSDVKDKSLKEGDVVLLSFSTCQRDDCYPCKEGRNGICSGMTEINFCGARGVDTSTSPIRLPDGTPVRGQFFGQSSLSKLAIVSQRSVVKCDVTLDDLPCLAPLGCGYLTGAGTVMNVMKPKTETRVVIFGMGAVGLAALLAAKASKVSTIIAVDIVNQKLELARSLGATHTINPKEVTDLQSGLRAIFPDGVDQVLDTTGVQFMQQSGLDSLRHEGILVIVGVSRPGNKIEVDPLTLMIDCKRVIGVIEGASNPAQVVPHLVQLYRDGEFPVDKLAKVYSATAIDQALEDLRAGKVIKPILSWEGL